MVNPILLIPLILCFAGPMQEEPGQTENLPSISADAPEHDFGAIGDRKTVSHIFKIDNKGTGTLILERVMPDKDCLVPRSFRDTAVGPGTSLDILVRFNPSRLIGEQTRTLRVLSNDPETPELVLTFKANVKVDFKLVKEFVFFKDIHQSGHLCETVQVKSYMEHPLEINHLVPSHDFFTATFRSDPEKDLYCIDIDLNVDLLPTGERRVAGKLLFDTNSELQPNDSLSVLASLSFEVVPKVAELEARELLLDSLYDIKIELDNRTESPFTVSNVRFTNDLLQIKKWEREGDAITVQYAIRDDIKFDTIEGRFEVTLDTEDSPKIIVPFKGKLDRKVVQEKRLLQKPARTQIPDVVNPTVNRTVKKKKLPADYDPTCCPIIAVDRESHDFGKVMQGELKETSFFISNIGHADLVIDRVKSGCGCATVTDLRGAIIPAGEKKELIVQLSTANKALKLSKSVRVISNDPVTPTKSIQIETDIHVDYLLKGPFCKFYDFREGMKETKRIPVQSYMDMPLVVENFQCPLDFVTCSFVASESDKHLYYIDLTIDSTNSKFDKDTINGRVTYTTNSPQLPKGSFNFVIETIQDIKFTPRKAFLYRMTKSKKVELNIYLTHVLGQPIKVKEIVTGLDCIDTEISNNGDASISLTLRLNENAEKGRYPSKIEVHLENASQEKVIIPLTVLVME